MKIFEENKMKVLYDPIISYKEVVRLKNKMRIHQERVYTLNLQYFENALEIAIK